MSGTRLEEPFLSAKRQLRRVFVLASRAAAFTAIGLCAPLADAPGALAQDTIINVVQASIGRDHESDVCGVQMWVQELPRYSLMVEFYYVVEQAPGARLAIRVSARLSDGKKLRAARVADAAIATGQFDTRDHRFLKHREALNPLQLEAGALKLQTKYRDAVDQSFANLPWHAIDVSATTESGVRLQGQIPGLSLDQQDKLRTCMQDSGYWSELEADCSTEGPRPCDLSTR